MTSWTSVPGTSMPRPVITTHVPWHRSLRVRTAAAMALLSLTLVLAAGAVFAHTYTLPRESTKSGATLLPTPEALAGGKVWIVQHDDSPDNTVLGVFATDDEAYAFMDMVKDDYENGVICSSFSIPYRSTDGAARYQAKD